MEGLAVELDRQARLRPEAIELVAGYGGRGLREGQSVFFTEPDHAAFSLAAEDLRARLVLGKGSGRREFEPPRSAGRNG